MSSAEDKLKGTAERAKQGATAQTEHMKESAHKAKAAAEEKLEKAKERISEGAHHGR
jgi:hypothetical protein